MKFLLLFFILLQSILCNTTGYIRYNDLGGKSYTVTYNNRSLLINGEPSLFISGAVHPVRFTESIFLYLFRYVG